jgi:hypothetical protein
MRRRNFLGVADGAFAGFFARRSRPRSSSEETSSASAKRASISAPGCEHEVEEKVVALDVGRILLELETRRDLERQEAEAPKAATPAMTDVEREEALELLRDPKLLERIADDLGRVGLVGELDNKLVAYLAATSRKLEEPLAVVIQSSSAAGKSSLMDAVARRGRCERAETMGRASVSHERPPTAREPAAPGADRARQECPAGSPGGAPLRDALGAAASLRTSGPP